MANIQEELQKMKCHIDDVVAKKRERLRNMDFFCLDNSIRESTVGQLRSHTLENKIEILKQVKKCGIKDMIIASFANSTRVDDDFVKYLKRTGEDFSNFYSFSEVSGKGVVNGTYETETIPIGLKKNEQYGIPNTVFEADFADEACEWDIRFTTEDMCKLIEKRINYAYENISSTAKIVVNLRDLPVAMAKVPQRVLETVKFLSQLPPERGVFAIAFEDPLGEALPEELEAYTAAIRRTMDASGQKSGKLIVHVHNQWDLKTASQLNCLSAGADGVWTSVCEEGASLGHACYAVTMMNLVRLGNTKILEKYNCTELRKAAIAVTQVTTGKPPHPKQSVYGERALDLVFGIFGIGSFNMAEFFGMKTPNRITSLVTTDMLIDELTNRFGKNEQFNETIASEMKKKILEDLRSGRKEEYQSSAGLAILFDRSGGKLTEEMADVIAKTKLTAAHHDNLIAEVRKEWDRWDVSEEGENKGDEMLQFDSFYHGFMAPYFGCYRCSRTKKGLMALDMDSDGFVDWKEFLVYLKWALREYPETEEMDVLLSIVFEKGLIPAMRDESIRKLRA